MALPFLAVAFAIFLLVSLSDAAASSAGNLSGASAVSAAPGAGTRFGPNAPQNQNILVVTKTAVPSTAVQGNTITYTIAAANGGSAGLSAVQVSDGLAGCTLSGPTGDSGTPNVIDSGEIWQWSCTAVAGTTDITNTAAVTATHPITGTIVATDTAFVDVIHPGLQVNKSPNSQTAVAGRAVTFTIYLTNTGDVPLSIAVSDPLAPDCAVKAPGNLAPGSASYTCTLANVQTSFVNVLAATGTYTSSSGTPFQVSDSDTALVNVIHPGISVSKLPTSQTIVTGQPATFNVQITNTGDVPLTLSVNDPAAPDCTTKAPPVLGLLSPATFSCSAPNVTAAFTNIITATGSEIPSPGTPSFAVTDVDSATVQVVNPGIVVSKSPPYQSALSGDPVTFTIEISNTGDVPLSLAAVDTVMPQCLTQIPASMLPQATTRFTCAHPGITADFTNIITVTGTYTPSSGVPYPVQDSDSALADMVSPGIAASLRPVAQTVVTGQNALFTVNITNTGDVPLSLAVSDLLVPDCVAQAPATLVPGSTSYTCTATNVTAGFTNIITVTGTYTPSSGIPTQVRSSDSGTVSMATLGILADKRPANQTVVTGQAATFTIQITNTGNVPLALAVADPASPDCVFQAPASLAPGSAGYTCTASNVTASFTNRITVTGIYTPSSGVPVTVRNSATAQVAAVNPAVNVSMTPANQSIISGNNAVFGVTITNPGDVPLALSVSDPRADANCVSQAPATLSVGAIVSYSCSATGVTADLTNVITVTGTYTPSSGTPLTVADNASAFVDAAHPAVVVTKAPAVQYIGKTKVVTFAITISNPGDVPLSLSTQDPAVPACASPAPTSLAAGAMVSYQCNANATGFFRNDFTNTITVTGTYVPSSGIPFRVTDSSSALVKVANPAIAVSKTPAYQSLLAGQAVTFTIRISNTGDVPLTLTVSDPLAPDCALKAPSTLAAFTTATYACSNPAVLADHTNVIAVTGVVTLTSGAQLVVSDSSSAVVDVVSPGIAINKTPSNQQVVIGKPVTFTVYVTNTGDAPLVITVSDPRAPDCAARAPISLPAQSSTSYSCSVASASADFTNIITVTGIFTLTSGAPITVSALDSAVVDVVHPGISISKGPAYQTVASGNGVTFTVRISNTGDVALGLTVSDPLSPDCANRAPATLAAQTNIQYACFLASATADFTNVINVAGTFVPTLGPPFAVNASGTAAVDVVHPSLTVSKTPNTQNVINGQNASFTIQITNTGDVPLAVSVIDPLVPGCASSGPTSLNPSASVSYPCGLSGVTADFTNVITVTGTYTSTSGRRTTVRGSDSAFVNVVNPGISVGKEPASQTVVTGQAATFTIFITNTGDVPLTLNVSDPVAPNCVTQAPGSIGLGSLSYTCTRANVTADVTNVITVTGTYVPSSNVPFRVSDSDSAFVNVIHPSLAIVKTPVSQYVVNGNSVSFTVTVTNTGDVNLTNVSVVDPIAPACGANASVLTPGAALVDSCTLSNIIADFTNTANVSARDPLNNLLTGVATATVKVINPSILVSKMPKTQYLYNGGTASFTVTVTNTGDVDLNNVTLVDPLASDCNDTIAALTPLQSVTSVCFRPNVTANFTNRITVTGQHLLGGTVSNSDSASVQVIAPTIAIAKTPATQSVVSGGTASFTILVTNTGNITLTNVLVTDAQAPLCNRGPLTLAAGASTTYSCTKDPVTADFLNNATVVGSDPLGRVVNSSDAAFVQVLVPNIAIDKTPDNQTVLRGSSASFNFVVRNTSAVTLTSVVVSDPLTPNCNRSLGTIVAGSSVNYQCTHPNVTAAFVNVAVVTGTTPIGGQVTTSDIARVDVLELTTSLQANPSSMPELGGTADFAVVVTNRSSKAVRISSLTSPQYGDLTLIPGTTCINGVNLVPNGGIYSCSFRGVVSGQPGNYNISVTATAVDGSGLPVSDLDTTTVTLTNVPSSITPKLRGSPAAIPEPGGNINFTVRVTNTSPVDVVTLSSLSVSGVGSLNGKGDCAVPQTLNPGAAYGCSFLSAVVGNPGDQIVRTLQASGTDDDGLPVSNSGQATITITDVPSSVSVTLSGVPTSVPEPSGVVAFTLRVDNTSTIDDITIGSLVDSSLGSLNGRGTCAVPQGVPLGGNYQCTYSANVSGNAGSQQNRTVVAAGTDDDGVSWIESDLVSISISDVPSSISVVVTAVPTTVATSGDSATITVLLNNTSPADSVTITSLSESMLGNLNGRGSCSTPQTILPGRLYQCSYSATISAGPGQSETHSIGASGVDDDGVVVNGNGDVIVGVAEISIQYLYLPTVMRAKVFAEPNDVCSDAEPLSLNLDYYFLAEDMYDWYYFDLPASGNLTVELTNFVPVLGQIVVYRGSSCGTLGNAIGNNGNFSPTKIVSLGTRPAGRYYIWIINDGTLNNADFYRLRVRSP